MQDCNIDTDKSQLILYLYNELENEEKMAFEKHLQECQSCQMQIQGYKEILNKISNIPAVKPSNHSYILSRCYRKQKMMSLITYGAIAASFILVAIISYLKLSAPTIITDNQTVTKLAETREYISSPIPEDCEKYSWNVGFTDEISAIHESVNTLGLILETSMPESIDQSIGKIDYDIKSISEEKTSSESD